MQFTHCCLYLMEIYTTRQKCIISLLSTLPKAEKKKGGFSMGALLLCVNNLHLLGREEFFSLSIVSQEYGKSEK